MSLENALTPPEYTDERSGEPRERERPGATRRTVLKTIGAGAAVGGPFATRAAARSDTFSTQLAHVRSSTRKYRDVATARADGYEMFAVNPPVGHVFRKAGYFDGATYTGPTDLEAPPSLLFYAPTDCEGDVDDAELLLAGVEYHVAGDRSADPPDLFADEEASRSLKVTEDEGWHRSPIPDALDVTGLHVWAHLRNPEGVFHVEHPTVRRMVCD